MINCHNCDFTCEEYQSLAKHIISAQHKRGLKWANGFLLKHVLFKEANPNEGRTPLSEQDRANKIDSQRELSGQGCIVVVQCPQCTKTSRQLLAEEFTRSNEAWKSKNNQYFVMCESCR